jgi:hypothetical protein
MMDLTTTYLGLELRNPLVASASPLSNTIAGIRQLADSGIGRGTYFSSLLKPTWVTEHGRSVLKLRSCYERVKHDIR